MKKVYIKAYTKFNLGNDLFIRALCNRYSDVKFYLVADEKYKEAFKDIKNLEVKFVNKSLIQKVLKLENKKDFDSLCKSTLKKCKSLVYVGGDIFVEPDSHKFEKLDILKDDILKVDNAYIISANFGPYETDSYYEYINQKIIPKLKSICFRDKYSFEKFNDNKNVRYAPDVVFSMDFSKYKVEPKKEIGISIINHLERKNIKEYYEKYQNKIIEIIKYYTKLGYKIKLFSFCEYEKDDEAIREIIEKIDDTTYTNNIEIVKYTGDIDKFLNAFASVEILFATRFYSMILGFKLINKVVPICYSEKLVNTLHDINFEGNYYNFYNVDKLDYVEIKDSKLNMNKIKKDATEQFLDLDRAFKPVYFKVKQD